LANPLRAQECPGVLSFIIENYNTLPDGMIFIHGYPFDHNENLVEILPRLLRLNRDLGLPPYDFVHLNDVWETPRCWKNSAASAVFKKEYDQLSLSEILGLDDELFGSEPPGAMTGCYSARFCCGQFLVSRAAVLSRPRSFYRLALKLTLERQECQ
jgi:hypothetical protein